MNLFSVGSTVIPGSTDFYLESEINCFKYLNNLPIE